MSRYQKEDILGLHFDSGEVICSKCATKDEWNGMKENEIIVENEEEVVFCDRCKEQL